jgi:hypothetical protein
MFLQIRTRQKHFHWIQPPTEGRLAAFSLEAVGEDPKGAMDALEQFLRLPKNRWQVRFGQMDGPMMWGYPRAMDFDDENET